MYQKVQLQNGIPVHCVTTDSFKTALLTVHFLVPLDDETACAYSLLTDVLPRGTEKYPTMQKLNQRTDELYSLGLFTYTQKRGETQIVTFELSYIDDAFTIEHKSLLPESLELLEQVIFHPYTENGVFKKEYVEQEKKNFCDDLLAKINNKSAYAKSRCKELMFAAEKYAATARIKPDDVQGLTAKALWDSYNRLLSTAHVEIVYVGRQSADEIASACNILPFQSGNRSLPRTNPGPLPSEVRTFTETMHVSQCNLLMGFRLAYENTPVNRLSTVVFNELFSNAPTSRLFTEVREKKSLCYSCNAQPDTYKSVLLVSSGIERENKQAVIDAILEQIRDIQNGNISDDELYFAKISLLNAYREITDNPNAIAGWYLSCICRGRFVTVDEQIKAINQITAKDIINVAASLRLDTIYSLEGEDNA